MADEMPGSTDELLAVIDDEWQALVKVIDQLTPQQMAMPDEGGWTPKDNLAHLATWMRYMLDVALHNVPGHEAMGIDAELYKQLDDNGMNAILLERNRAKPVDDVLAALKKTYADAVNGLRNTPFEQLTRPLRPNNPRTVLGFVLDNTSNHMREHRATIEKAL
ncbi:MAG: DinB family protein [Anaerolineae bacterium]